VILFLYHCIACITMHSMSSQTSPDDQSSSFPSTLAVSHGSVETNDSIQTELLRTSQKREHSPIMLSDALDSPSSDTKSFDEEDMFGQDSGIDTISLTVPPGGPASPDQDIHEYDVCTFISDCGRISHFQCRVQNSRLNLTE
jgi:hypothetical protein